MFIAVGEEGPLPPVEGADTVQRLYGGIDQDGARARRPRARPSRSTIFNDLQCTDCADYHLETVPPLIEGLVRPGDAKLEFRHRAIGLKVVTAAAVGAAAAGLQGYEWPTPTSSFLNQESHRGHRARPTSSSSASPRRSRRPSSTTSAGSRTARPPEVTEQIESDDLIAADLGLASPAVVVEGPQRQHRARRFALGLATSRPRWRK